MQLKEIYGLEEWRAKRVLEIAVEFGRKAEPCEGGFVHVVYRGCSQYWPYTERFQIYNHADLPAKRVATGSSGGYTSGTPAFNPKKEKIMPARGRPAARTATRTATKTAPEPAVEEPDVTPYLEKAFTPTMQDYIEWAEDTIGPLDDLPSDRLLVLGSQLYPKFAASEFNISRREARKAERASARAASNGAEEEDEEEPARPTRSRRGAAATSRPARARRAAAEPEEDEEEAPAKPARRGRKPAAKASEAPY